MKQRILLGLALSIALAACRAPATETRPQAPPELGQPPSPVADGQMGRGMGRGAGMMQRHSAAIPAEYVGRTNPIPANEESLARGATIFTANCASCHGDGGMGDGPAGVSLDPPPAPIARSSQMMGDAYLFWRISEGGVPFNTAMPVWKEALDEQARWDVINYVRAVGAGDVVPERSAGGAMFDPAAEAAAEAEMLARAVEQGVITQAQADAFQQVHAIVDEYRATNPPDPSRASPGDMEGALLSELVAAGKITQAQADAFVDIRDRLAAEELMP